MTLARRMLIATSLLVLNLLVVSSVAWWGLSGLGQELDVALAEYRKLKAVLEIGENMARARAVLEGSERADPRVFRELQSASMKLSLLLREDELKDPQIALLKDLLRWIAENDYDITPPTPEQQMLVINSMVGFLAKLGTQSSAIIEAAQRAADAKRQTTILIVGLVSAAVTLAAFAVAIWQYSSVMRPLGKLRSGVKTIAQGRFSDRLDTRGDREFAELAHDFNLMAAELDELYRELEEKVAIKSKELVRSERLASVGFLAAGVAHEINNPLGIMSGYAELSLRQLNNNKPDAAEHAKRSLEIICDEALRCKKIIQKLLSLVRGGGQGGGQDELAKVPIAGVVTDVAEIVRGLPKYRARKIEIEANADGAAVMGRETELKQVLLNLVINALEATDPKGGIVKIRTRLDGDRLTLEVIDNGKGMTRDTLDHIFEPFFTNKRGVTESNEERGTGLGLSITHAIVQQHGGRIHAYSAGPGMGSKFTVELPVG